MLGFSKWLSVRQWFPADRSWTRAAALAIAAALTAPVSVLAQVAEVTHSPDGLAFEPLVAVDSLTVSASGPGDIDVRRTYPGGGTAVFLIFDENGDVLPDGTYSYQLTGAPTLHPDTQAALAACREAADCDSLVAALRQSGALPDEAEMVQSGSFTIEAGYMILPTEDEALLTNAQVITQDLIVQGSLCVGIDCATNESFGFDTTRLKENNLRIHFFDTSTSASFPSNDWRIAINSSDNGGANYFRVEDANTSRVPFTILAGAANDSLVVDAQGDIGFGTPSPVVQVHTRDGNTPTLRLEQDGSSGFTPQTWDVAGNEANFFVRDVTNGSEFPFKIKPGADTGSLFIAANNNVGIGSENPGASLEVRRSNGTSQILVDENSSTVESRTLLRLENNGRPLVRLSNADSGVNWEIGIGVADAFAIQRGKNTYRFNKGGRVLWFIGGAEKYRFNTDGSMVIAGTLTENSDVNAKRDIVPVDDGEVLAQVAALPVSTWRYKDDEAGARHLGPMAQDFHAAFGLGVDDTHVAPRDVAGVALAAVKALQEVVREKDARIEELQAELKRRVAAFEELDARVAALEERYSRRE